MYSIKVIYINDDGDLEEYETKANNLFILNKKINRIVNKWYKRLYPNGTLTREYQQLLQLSLFTHFKLTIHDLHQELKDENKELKSLLNQMVKLYTHYHQL